jgi:uncharacterized SAM-binding protein YcdF (DUF218 family)
MFLFLSKLLPLLLYPLGLASLLLVVALILLWRRPRWAAAAIASALALLVVSSNSWVATGMIQSLEWRHLPASPLPQADAIVVLGGAIKPQHPPRPWVDVTEQGDRVLHGSKLYLEKQAPLIIFSGGRITWGQGQDRSEADDMATIALALGVPRSAIVIEPNSLNTFQNATNVKTILQERQLQRVLLVTSAMHMPRALAIFKHLGIDTIAAPTDFHVAEDPQDVADNTWQGRLLSLIPDTENLHYFTRALKEYIGISVYWLRGWL